MALPALPAVASGSQSAPPARTIALACPAERVTGAEFADAVGSVHRDSIRCLAWYGIAKGTADGTYAGDRAVTRAQLATFLVRVLEQAGVAVPAAAPDAFVDDEGNPHEASLDALAALGVVKGGAAGQVDPDDAVRRDQMASLLVRILELVEDDDLADAVEDYFDDDEDNVHRGAINALAGLGIAAGRGAGMFDPASEVRREQLATFLMRLVDRLVAQQRIHVPFTLRLSAEEVTPGQVVTGELLGDGIDSVALSGCGVDGPVVDEDTETAGVQFSFTVPAAFPVEGGSDEITDAPGATEAADSGEDDISDAPQATEGGDGGEAGGEEAEDDDDLEVVVTTVDGRTVTLDADLELADVEDGTDEDGTDEDDESEGDGSEGDESEGDGSEGDGSEGDGSDADESDSDESDADEADTDESDSDTV